MQPLSGMRVLDFTHAVAGPFCTYHLQLLGADVIKVERPGIGDDLRHIAGFAGVENYSSLFVCANSGKRSITLDLKQPQAREICERIARDADVVVENYAPGVMGRLGLGWEQLRKINPKLVYCSLSGFGQTGELRDRTAYDHIIQAMSGIMWANGEPDQPPLRLGIPIADAFSGYQAHAAIVAALLQRTRSGEGQFIDVSMLDAVLVMMSAQVATTSMGGQPPQRLASDGFRAVASSGIFKAKDNYVALGANHPHQFEPLCRALGLPELLTDERFANVAARRINRLALRKILEEVLAKLTASEIERKLSKIRVPVSVVRTLPETLKLEHLKARGSLHQAVVPGQQSTVAVVKSGYTFEHDSPKVQGPVPAIGEHTDAVLREFGYTNAEVSAFHEQKVV